MDWVEKLSEMIDDIWDKTGGVLKTSAVVTSLTATVDAGSGWDSSGVAKESGGVLADIAARLYSAGLVNAADILAAIKTKTDNLPSDPAKESGKLADIAGTRAHKRTNSYGACSWPIQPDCKDHGVYAHSQLRIRP